MADHPIDDATRVVNEVLDHLGPPPADPTETWRAALGQSTSARLSRVTDEANELTRLLLETRQALAASQAELTGVKAERDALAVLNAELKAEAADFRAANERNLERLDRTQREVASANHRNRILTAENEAALRALNELKPTEES